jgi:hypothetical protein
LLVMMYSVVFIGLLSLLLLFWVVAKGRPGGGRLEAFHDFVQPVYLVNSLAC